MWKARREIWKFWPLFAFVPCFPLCDLTVAFFTGWGTRGLEMTSPCCFLHLPSKSRTVLDPASWNLPLLPAPPTSRLQAPAPEGHPKPPQAPEPKATLIG